MTPAEFLISAPLYEKITLEDEAGNALIFYAGPLDTYCPVCGSHSIFRRWLSGTPSSNSWRTHDRRDVELTCSRNSQHKLLFLLMIDAEKRTIQKIGQCPSIADLNMYDVKKYASVLGKTVFPELTKAIGLAAHGIGVGSFVYLRRIFEGLVQGAHQVAKSDEGWAEEEYEKARMGEKIQLLHRHLPSFLVENRAIYGILSKGIHELSEAECLDAFPVVKVSIEIILDAKLEEDARRKKLEAATKKIQALAAATSH